MENIINFTFEDIANDYLSGAKQKFPQCIDGAKKCPPEDVGSIEGYFSFVESMRTKNEDYEENLEWFGSHYNENEFNVKLVNKRLLKDL